MKQVGFAFRSNFGPAQAGMAEIRIAGGNVHRVPADRRLMMAVGFVLGKGIKNPAYGRGLRQYECATAYLSLSYKALILQDETRLRSGPNGFPVETGLCIHAVSTRDGEPFLPALEVAPEPIATGGSSPMAGPPQQARSG
jgi:hypothetical protein